MALPFGMHIVFRLSPLFLYIDSSFSYLRFFYHIVDTFFLFFSSYHFHHHSRHHLRSHITEIDVVSTRLGFICEFSLAL